MTYTRNHLVATLVLVLVATALSGCSTWSPRARASAECWMSVEKGHASMSLDQRSEFVDKCIKYKMKGRMF